MNRFSWIILFFTFFWASSCEKSIQFDLDESSPKLVVEAIIENEQAPLVLLSSSLNFFSTISNETLENSFVHNASILITEEGSNPVSLKEYSLEVGGGLTLYYYTIDSFANPGFAGKLGKAYSLQIQLNGQTYTAETTIPELSKTLDSIWWEPAPDNPDTSKVIVMARTSDPPGYGNYIRYFTSTNDNAFYPGLNSVFDDQIIDGETYSVQVEQGVNRNEEIDFEEYAFFSRGDSVTVKFCNIDKATYDFWRTMEYSYASIGNPFSSPTKVLSNIRGNALGYFGGYAVQYISLVIPE